MESRPLRLSPEVAKIVEEHLRPLSGQKLERAQAAILKVYTSGQQMSCEQWIAAYSDAIQSAVSGQQAAA